METKLDKFGRVVIPKALRDECGLEAGAVLEVSRDETGIALKPVREQPLLVRENGVLVYTGELTGDPTDIIARVREERTRRIAGMDI